MKHLTPILFLAALLSPAAPQTGVNPFLGRWDVTVTTAKSVLVDWLGVSDANGHLDIRYQPPGGNVYQVKGFELEGSHLTLHLAGDNSWELTGEEGKLVGVQKHGADVVGQVSGVRAPALIHAAPAEWTAPEPLFNGQDLSGWEPTVASAVSHWVVRDGELVNEAHGANLKTTRKFDDFKLHVEYNCPDDGNSGIYLRGRYEVQIEYEPLDHNPPERRIGSVYGFLTPSVDLPRIPGKWETFDVTLVGRTVTVVRDGTTIIDAQEIPGVTGGALDSQEGEPGPIYIQGDHTGGLRFRNITISVPK